VQKLGSAIDHSPGWIVYSTESRSKRSWAKPSSKLTREFLDYSIFCIMDTKIQKRATGILVCPTIGLLTMSDLADIERDLVFRGRWSHPEPTPQPGSPSRAIRMVVGFVIRIEHRATERLLSRPGAMLSPGLPGPLLSLDEVFRWRSMRPSTY